MRHSMDEATGRFWTTVFGGITALGLLAGGLYTVVEYLNAKQAEQRNAEAANRNFALQLKLAELEAKKPFFSKLLELCSDATAAAAILANSKDPAEKKRAAQTFWKLYWGPLGIVEKQKVDEAMYKFGRCLNSLCDGEPIENLSLKLAHACRDEISESWDLKLPDILDKSDPLKPDK